MPPIPDALMLLTLTDLERAARERLSAMAWGYYASGADDQTTLADNLAAFDRLRLRPRVLVDVSQRALQTTVLGRAIELPVLVAPTAMQGLAHARGEQATAEATTGEATVSSQPAAPFPRWRPRPTSTRSSPSRGRRRRKSRSQ